MAVYSSAATFIALMAVIATVFSLVGTSMAADAPAPSPTSAAGSIYPSFVVGCALTYLAFLFGSALKL